MQTPRHAISTTIRALAFGALLIAGACTSSDDTDNTGVTTTESLTVNPIDPVAAIVDACRKEMLEPEPNIQRLAFDPSVTNLALGLLPNDVPKAADGLVSCLGQQNTAIYLAADLIIGGQTLPAGTSDCFLPLVIEDGEALVEGSLRRTRLEDSSEDIGETFIDALLECVPGRFFAAPMLTENPEAYAEAVDEECLDEAHEADPEPLLDLWRFETYGETFSPTTWTEDEVRTNVAALYACIDTGAFIAGDPNITIDLSTATRSCLSDVAVTNSYWESRVAQRPFDETTYQAETNACLTPEEALVLFGTPLPVDDPAESSFDAVATCFADDVVNSDSEFDELDEQLEASDADQVVQLSARLVGCAAEPGVAGRYAASRFLGRALPQGSYDCFLTEAEEGDVATLLEGILLVQARQEARPASGRAYIDAFTSCVAPNIYSQGIFRDYTRGNIALTIDTDCIDQSYASGTDAAEAYWSGIAFGGLRDGNGPTALATAAVAALYDCVEPGEGFAAAVAEAGAELSETTIVCIDESTKALQPLEIALDGGALDDGVFNQSIADCLTDDEIEDIQNG